MRRAASALLAGTLGLVSCGGDDDDRAAAPTASAPRAGSTSTVAPLPAATSASPVSVATTTTVLVAMAPPPPPIPQAPPPPPPPPTPAPSTLPPLPAPVGAPLDEDAYEDTFEVGILDIPEIGLTTRMREGIRLSTLDRGPGHWPGTALPGQLGNVVIAAHRTSHNAEFRHLDDLEPGDEVVMTTLGGRFVYQVVSVEIVEPEALWIVDQTPAHTATLFACHPPGSVRQRIVAHLELTV